MLLSALLHSAALLRAKWRVAAFCELASVRHQRGLHGFQRIAPLRSQASTQQLVARLEGRLDAALPLATSSSPSEALLISLHSACLRNTTTKTRSARASTC